MKRIIALSVLWCLVGNLFAQSEFSVVKTDDSEFPQIDLWIRADSGTVNTQNVVLYSEDNEEIPYQLDKISGFKHDKESAVLMILFAGDSDDMNNRLTEQTGLFLDKNRKEFKLNVAVASHQNNDLHIDFISPELSADHHFFRQKLASYNWNSDTVPEAGHIIRQAMDRMTRAETHIMNFSVFLIGHNYRLKHDEKLIHGLLQSDIHVYGLLSDSIDARNEENLISLCSRTGGMYTKAPIEKYPETMKAYSEDALLYASVAGYEFFRIQFKSQSKAAQNYGIVSNGEKEVSFSYYRKRLLGKDEIYQLSILLLVIILFYFILMFFIHKRKLYYLRLKSRRQETIPASDKKAVLLVQSAGVSKKYALENNRYTIGRNEKNDIVLDNETVSSFHAEIIKENGLYFIIDKGSTNGIISEGKHIVKEKLKRSMQLRLGDAYIKVSYE